MANPVNFSRTLANPDIEGVVDPHLLPPLARIVAEYAAQKPFGPERWSEYYRGFRVADPAFPLPDEFYAWWRGADPIEPSKRVCETHLLPVYCPQHIRWKRRIVPYTLTHLSSIVKVPRKGYGCAGILPARFVQFEDLFDRNPGPGRWLVARKEVVARNQTSNQQLQKYALPSAIDLATIALTHYTVTGECYLGTVQGMEEQETWSHCREDGSLASPAGDQVAKVCVGFYLGKDEIVAGSPPGLVISLPEYKQSFAKSLVGRAGKFETSSPSIGVALVREFGPAAAQV